MWWLLGAQFLIYEGIALADSQPGDTLSEHVWALIETSPGTWGSGIAILLGWLGFHFLVEPRWPKYPPRPKDDQMKEIGEEPR
jgi:hypothetical protein